MLQRPQNLQGLAFGQREDKPILFYDPLIIAFCGDAVKMDPLDFPGGICPIDMGLITVNTAEITFFQAELFSGVCEITGTGPDIEQKKAVVA